MYTDKDELNTEQGDRNRQKEDIYTQKYYINSNA